MRDWAIIDHQDTPDGDSTLYLVSDGPEFAIHVDGFELMGNIDHGSEDALADRACELLEDRSNARVLVGGLGMGFTLAAALRQVGPEGEVTVAELMPKVVEWNQRYVGDASGHPLQDPRARVYQGDVVDMVLTPPQPWDAILLDVDNGPRALSAPRNGWLYTRQGIRAARQALAPGGVLAVWSAHGDRRFTTRLRREGFDVTVVHCPQYDDQAPDENEVHVIWLARPRKAWVDKQDLGPPRRLPA